MYNNKEDEISKMKVIIHWKNNLSNFRMIVHSIKIGQQDETIRLNKFVDYFSILLEYKLIIRSNLHLTF